VPDHDEAEVLTIKAAAEVLDVSEQTLRRWGRPGNCGRNVTR
jgi:predicted site-specific integrase-resolvase